MNTPRRAWFHALAFAAVLFLLQAGGDGVRTALRFSRQALGQGEWWRLLSGHVVHLGWTHTLLNIAGVLLCCALAPWLFNSRVWFRIVALALGVGMLLWWLSPGVSLYVGFSGVLYGLLVLGLLPQARHGDGLSALALLATVLWMAWQWLAGPSSAEEKLIGGHIIGIAHIYGFTLGLIGAVSALMWRRRVESH
ncbi:rhombosortase [Pusillimonas sp. MFBS29]|uniref:rhombosortase n=1 Tax=Pusillimonas sp. MFBS29 TaxID=2886690 RepID=UPI001D0F8F9F|nr:rhombosortase [Pusillimonas sp. MFBS29]MCC2596704.1 rhombosortase [Pusillimonas sp. MFBS29]